MPKPEIYVLSHYKSNQTNISVTVYQSLYFAQVALEKEVQKITDKYQTTHKIQITKDNKHNMYTSILLSGPKILLSGPKIILQHHLSITKLKGDLKT